MLPQEGFQFSKVTDVMTCIVAARNARPYDLHRRDPQPVASLDLGIRIVAHHQHLFRSELVSIQNPRKDALFAFSVGFINRIHVDCRKESLKPECLNLAFLKSPKARSHQEARDRQFCQRVKVGIAAHRRGYLQSNTHRPTGGEHVLRESVLFSYEIQWVAPAIGKRLRKRLVRKPAMVYSSDRVKDGSKSPFPGSS